MLRTAVREWHSCSQCGQQASERATCRSFHCSRNARQGFQEEAGFLRLVPELEKPLKPFACCAYYVGMRRGEMFRLEIADVDLSGGFIEIRKTKNKEARLVPNFDGPMREWVTWAVENRLAGQTKLLVWEDARSFTERNFYCR